MHGKPVDQLVHEHMFPNPQATDPATFHEFQQQLVREVRLEVMAFFGHLDTPEAKYPGLDYSHPTHRIRLSRYKWHRRLFRAFDALGLTPNEIASLTKWEGTRWAKDRYEKEQGITIQDTTEAEFTPRVPLHERRAREALQAGEEPEEEKETETGGDDSDEELASVGVHLNERLRERVALRNVSGDLTTILDEEWEQWLKNVIERGDLTDTANDILSVADMLSSPASLPAPSINPDAMPPGLMAAARNGQWDQIPDFLRPVMEQILDSEVTISPPPFDNPDLAQGTTRRAYRVRRGGRAFERARRIAGPTPQLLLPSISSQINGIFHRRLFLDAQLEAARAQVADSRARRYTLRQGSD